MTPPRLLAMALILSGATAAQALTLFRIGGEDLPEPELEAPFDFVQLPWEGIDGNQFGGMINLELQPGFISPKFADSEVNLTPSTLEGNFRYKDLGGDWQIPERVPQYIDRRWSVRFADADPNSYYADDRSIEYLFDFQRQVHLSRIRFYTRVDDGTIVTCGFGRNQAGRGCRNGNLEPIPEFLIGTSDGDPAKEGTRPFMPRYHQRVGPGERYDFDVVYEGQGRDLVDLSFPSIPTQRLLFKISGQQGVEWEIAEFEIYASGYAPTARYTSNVIDLGEEFSLGDLAWAGLQGSDPDSRVEITMRSGDDEQPNVYWRRTFRGDEQVPFSSRGAPLTPAAYNRLEPPEKGDIRHDNENWVTWNAAYDFAPGRGRANADRPRRYVQFDVSFLSTPESGGQVQYLQFPASPPLITEAPAEITPAAAPVGEVTAFTYRIRPRLEPGDGGFDGITIETPAQIVAVEPVGRIGGSEVEVEVIRMDEEGFAVQIPRVDIERTEELVEVTFQARVFEYDTPFIARLSDSETPFEVPQPVTEGDADEATDSNRLRVALTDIPDRAIESISLSSPLFTPNGDGVNDALRIEYELVNLSGDVPAVVGVYDLSGRRVGEVDAAGPGVSGLFSVSWDGTGEGGVLPPGLYLLQLEIATDTGSDRAGRIVSIAY
ncbi:MAG: gliding motility-associated C-terminal domain-containing protein [Gemmatimonadetes bacterium]|nr:gliding motility-associated C-terminal domain-containing protein [Gemmatimonadota bacterium]